MNFSGTGFDNNVFDEWIDTVPWLNVDLVNWVRFCLFIFFLSCSKQHEEDLTLSQDIWNDILDESSHDVQSV